MIRVKTAKFIKLITVLAIVLSLFLITNNSLKIKAQSYITSWDSIAVLDSPGNLKMEYQILLDNNGSNVLSTFTVSVPFVKISQPKATLQDSDVSLQSQDSNGVTQINIQFNNFSIKPNDKKLLKINFLVLSMVEPSMNSKFVKIPGINNQVTSLKLIYPKTYGKLSSPTKSIYELEEGETNDSLVMKQEKTLQFIWGDSSIDVQSTNEYSSTYNVEGLYPLIPSYNFQNIKYKNIYNSDYGLVDPVGNFFAKTTFTQGEKKTLGYQARISINTDTENNWNNMISEPFFDLSQPIVQKLVSLIGKEGTKIDKLQKFNDFIIENSEVATSPEIDINRNVWEKLDKKEPLTDYDYAFLVASTAKYLEIPANINYGYILPYYQSENLPIVWARVNLDGNIFIIDPFLEKKLNISMFGIASKDRITLGSWDKEYYNDILGRLGNSIKKIEFLSLGEFGTNDPLTLNADFPKELFSGEFYSGFVLMDNRTNLSKQVTSIKIEDDEILHTLAPSPWKLMLLPNQVNQIKLDYLREPNFLLEKSKNLSLKVVAADEEFSSTVTISFKQDVRLFIIALMAILIVMAIIAAYIYRLTIGHKSKNRMVKYTY